MSPCKHSTRIRRHIAPWLPKDLVNTVIDYERSWEGEVKIKITTPNLTLWSVIDENRWLMRHIPSMKTVIYNLTTRTYRDFASACILQPLNFQRFLFQDYVDGTLKIADFSDDECKISSLSSPTLWRWIVHVIDGQDGKLILAQTGEDEYGALHIFDQRDKSILFCEFRKQEFIGLLPSHFAVLPTSEQREMGWGVRIFKIGYQLEYIVAIPVPSAMHPDYRIIYNHSLSSLIAIDSACKICLWDLTDLAAIPAPSVWYLFLTETGGHLSASKPVGHRLIIGRQDRVPALVLEDGRLLVRLRVTSTIKSRKSKKIILAVVDFLSRIITTSKAGGNFDDMILLSNDRVALREQSKVTILE
jgi:hypothetical protein